MNRSTILLIALLVVLAVAAYFFWPSVGEREASYDSSAPGFTVDSSAVTKIEIRPPGKAVTLENVGGAWMVTSPVRYPANATSVSQLVGSLSKFKRGSLVSSNPDRQSVFQVDSSTATHLVVTERSGKVTSMLVGKMGPSFSEVYFRLPSSNDVYLGEGLSPWTLGQEVKDWRDRSILSMVQDSLTGIEIVYGKKFLNLRKIGATWFSGADSVAPSVISSALSILGNLRADDFLDTPPQIVTSPISIKVSGPEQVVLDFFPLPLDSAKYAVRTSKSGQMFEVSKSSAQQFIDLTGKLAK